MTSAAEVTATIDCGAPMALTAVGGWTYRGAAPALTPGTHVVQLHAATPAGRVIDKTVRFEA